jgi:hypothetical protein
MRVFTAKPFLVVHSSTDPSVEMEAKVSNLSNRSLRFMTHFSCLSLCARVCVREWGEGGRRTWHQNRAADCDVSTATMGVCSRVIPKRGTTLSPAST